MAYKRANARPEPKKYIDDISGYDVIYIGGPIYRGELPYEVYTELDKDIHFQGGIMRAQRKVAPAFKNCTYTSKHENIKH